MVETLIHSLNPVTLVGGSPFSKADFDLCQRTASVLVAADSGADQILRHGFYPTAVIGDFDSISTEAHARLLGARLYEIKEQETTDFDKALRSISAPYILALGFSGARLDHALAVMNSLVRHAGRPCVLVGEEDVSFALPAGRHHLDLALGERISLFPLAQVRARSQGLTWPLDGHDFAPDGFIATSNRASASRVTIEVETAGFLTILPKSQLKAAIHCVTSFANTAVSPRPVPPPQA